MKTVAIVLTYNRLSLLKECIKCLRNQSIPADGIIVVNNGSIDGTAVWLSQQADLSIVTMAVNIGGSGGFKRAIEEAYKLKSDWIWLLDDDAFPDKDCLKNLYQVAAIKNNNQIVLAPLVIEGDDVDHLHRGYVNFNKIQFPLQIKTNNQIFETENNIVDISFASFIGMFIGRDIITKIDFPHSHYFIFQEDLEYSMRITRAGYPIYLVKDAVIHHKIKGTVPVHHFTSNQYCGEEKKKERRTVSQIFNDKRDKYSDLSKINLLLFISKRNWLWTIMQYNGMNFQLILFLIKDIFRSSAYVVLSRSNRRLLLHLFYTMYSQGLSGKFDNSSILSVRNA